MVKAGKDSSFQQLRILGGTATDATFSAIAKQIHRTNVRHLIIDGCAVKAGSAAWSVLQASDNSPHPFPLRVSSRKLIGGGAAAAAPPSPNTGVGGPPRLCLLGSPVSTALSPYADVAVAHSDDSSQ